MIITKIKATEILDSKSTPTISTTIWLEDGTYAKGEVPSGASTGDTEVLEMRDGDRNRYNGKGVLKAVEIVNNEISKAIVGKNFNTQEDFDNFLIDLDGTKLKTKLGGNSILSCSMAFCRATAKYKGIELYEYFRDMFFKKDVDLSLPIPQILIMEGGAHGNWATDFQEFMVIPKAEKFSSFREMLRAGSEIFHATHDILVEKGYSATVGFEGAFAPIQIQSNTEAFDIILKGIEKAGYIPNEQFTLSIDAAASEFFNKEKQTYDLKRENKSLSSSEWISYQKDWYAKYPISALEDIFDQEDWTSWSIFTKEVGDKYMIIGDDFYTTNVERIRKGIASNATTAVLIKLNQIGTVTETLNAIRLTQETGWTPVISHRGGETNDDMIADLVVGTNSKMSKFGGPDRGERLAKYNRLLEIENKLLNI